MILSITRLAKRYSLDSLIELYNYFSKNKRHTKAKQLIIMALWKVRLNAKRSGLN